MQFVDKGDEAGFHAHVEIAATDVWADVADRAFGVTQQLKGLVCVFIEHDDDADVMLVDDDLCLIESVVAIAQWTDVCVADEQRVAVGVVEKVDPRSDRFDAPADTQIGREYVDLITEATDFVHDCVSPVYMKA